MFVGLIITNCIVMGRAEGYAMQNPPWPSFLDGIGNGLGYALVLIAGRVRPRADRRRQGAGLHGAAARRTTAAGTCRNGLMLLAPSALFIVALLIWALRTWKPELQEKD